MALEQYWNANGRCPIEEVFSKCLMFYLDNRERRPAPRKKKEMSSGTLPAKLKQPSRYIPREVKQRVREEAGNQCQFVDPKTGRRCKSRYRLEYDHQLPFALGGRSERENLRLLCGIHNAYEANRLSLRRRGAWFRETLVPSSFKLNITRG
jgi:hypothetical protein